VKAVKAVKAVPAYEITLLEKVIRSPAFRRKLQVKINAAGPDYSA
jgi:hypothetical protein